MLQTANTTPLTTSVPHPVLRFRTKEQAPRAKPIAPLSVPAAAATDHRDYCIPIFGMQFLFEEFGYSVFHCFLFNADIESAFALIKAGKRLGRINAGLFSKAFDKLNALRITVFAES